VIPQAAAPEPPAPEPMPAAEAPPPASLPPVEQSPVTVPTPSTARRKGLTSYCAGCRRRIPGDPAPSPRQCPTCAQKQEVPAPAPSIPAEPAARESRPLKWQRWKPSLLKVGRAVRIHFAGSMHEDVIAELRPGEVRLKQGTWRETHHESWERLRAEVLAPAQD
jgi:hypothetical protein